MPPKPRSLSVSKQCEDCGSANPVACKTCTACGADFYSSSLDKSDSPGEPGSSEVVSDTPSTPSSDRRRSQRGGGKKPDYYDALEFETKRKPGVGPATPTRKARSSGFDKIPYKSPRTSRQNSDGGHETTPQRGRPRKTMLDVRDKRNKKKKLIKEICEGGANSQKENSRESVNDPEEEMTTVMDDLPPEKSLKLKVSLAEINRRLGGVICQPV